MPRLISAKASVLQQVPLRVSYKVALADGSLDQHEILKESTVAESTTNRDEFNSGHYDHSTGRFTAPFEGVYYFCVHFMRNNQASGAPQLRFIKNGGSGSMWARTYDSTYSGTSYQTAQLITITNLKAGDYVEVTTTDSGPTSFYSDDSYVMGFLIG